MFSSVSTGRLMRKMGEEKKNGHPEKLPIFSKVKKWAPAKKKWAQNGNLAKKSKNLPSKKNQPSFTREKCGLKIFSLKDVPKKKKGKKWALDHFQKMGALNKKKRSSAHFFSKKRCPSSLLAYLLSNYYS